MEQKRVLDRGAGGRTSIRSRKSGWVLQTWTNRRFFTGFLLTVVVVQLGFGTLGEAAVDSNHIDVNKMEGLRSWYRQQTNSVKFTRRILQMEYQSQAKSEEHEGREETVSTVATIESEKNLEKAQVREEVVLHADSDALEGIGADSESTSETGENEQRKDESGTKGRKQQGRETKNANPQAEVDKLLPQEDVSFVEPQSETEGQKYLEDKPENERAKDQENDAIKEKVDQNGATGTKKHQKEEEEIAEEQVHKGEEVVEKDSAAENKHQKEEESSAGENDQKVENPTVEEKDQKVEIPTTEEKEQEAEESTADERGRKEENKTEEKEQEAEKSIAEERDQKEENKTEGKVLDQKVITFEDKTQEQETAAGLYGQKDEASPAGEEKEEQTQFQFSNPPYLLTPTIKDWDEQRQAWLDANPQFKSDAGSKPRVLIVTGSTPKPCSTAEGDHFHVRSLKQKIDYASFHNFEIFYNFVHFDPLFDSYWVKIPTVRTIMLAHPEIEWFFWLDSDAVFTDMLFEPPWETYEGYNMVMWGNEEGVLKRRSWVAYNAGVFLIRNCQWALDLMDTWSPYGPKTIRDDVGKFLNGQLSYRSEGQPGDDQSALTYVMIIHEDLKSKIRLVEWEYQMSAYWKDVVDSYETLIENYHPGLGDMRWPWITHFTGCSPCNGDYNPEFSFAKCMDSLNRAFHFADNQVLAYWGFQHESLSSPNITRIRNETDRPLENLEVNPWAERIAQVAAK